jgi:hypothetical protein
MKGVDRITKCPKIRGFMLAIFSRHMKEIKLLKIEYILTKTHKFGYNSIFRIESAFPTDLYNPSNSPHSEYIFL